MLKALSDKSIDVINKSMAIHELLKEYGLDTSTILQELFQDRLFQFGTHMDSDKYSGIG